MPGSNLINMIHSIVYDECYSLPAKDAKRIASKISKYCKKYFVERIHEYTFESIEDVSIIYDYIMELEDWPFDDFEKQTGLIIKYNIVLNIIDEDLEENLLKLRRQGCEIVDNLMKLIKNMD